MKILLTGVSSFSGYWFAKELASQGHDVTGVLTRSRTSYQAIRKIRINEIASQIDLYENCSVGDERFLGLLNKGHWDFYCHHGAYMESYRSMEFDYLRAIQTETKGLPSIARILKDTGCSLIFTGTVAEPGEGKGSDDIRAFSPYGAARTATYELFRVHCETLGVKTGKFVVPNPFGPLEEAKFPSYLMKSWKKNQVPVVKTPLYVRDNIHIDLLARAYTRFCETVAQSKALTSKTNPSQYIESMGDFTARFAREISKRLSWKCDFELAQQTEFPEPKIRTNTDSVVPLEPTWNESSAWDALARYFDKNIRLYEN